MHLQTLHAQWEGFTLVAGLDLANGKNGLPNGPQAFGLRLMLMHLVVEEVSQADGAECKANGPCCRALLRCKWYND